MDNENVVPIHMKYFSAVKENEVCRQIDGATQDYVELSNKYLEKQMS